VVGRRCGSRRLGPVLEAAGVVLEDEECEEEDGDDNWA
jgi:hypothetical protein